MVQALSDRSKTGTYLSFPVIAGQNPWLDLLRSVAILLVLFRHGEKAFPQSTDGFGLFVHNLFANGWVGVDLFLVLSGYLITKSLIRSQNSDGFLQVGQYFRSRAFRIIPAYYVTLFVIAFGWVPFYTPYAEVTPTTIFYHLLFLQDYLPSHINVVFWSLGVEEKFYILAPLLILVICAFRQWRLGLGILCALLAVSPICKVLTFNGFSGEISYQIFFETLRSPFHQSLEPLLIGVMIGFVTEKTALRLPVWQAKAGLLLSSLICLVWLAVSDFHADFTMLDLTVQPVGFALLFGTMVLCATQLDRVPLRGNRVWRPIARLSYALYLVHYPLIPLCLVIAAASALPWLSFWVFFILFSSLAALALHFLVEKPGLLLKTKTFTRTR